MSASNVLGKDRAALATGASRVIGPLIAAQIARRGGHGVLTGRSAADLKAATRLGYAFPVRAHAPVVPGCGYRASD